MAYSDSSDQFQPGALPVVQPTGPGPPKSISCLFCVQQAGELDVFEILTEICVLPSMLCWRAGALSVTVAGLFFGLRLPDRLWAENPIIQDLIAGDGDPSAALSTTRVPDLSSLSAAAAGYRRLITLAHVQTLLRNFDTSTAPDLALPFEIIAATRSSNSSATELLNMWAPMGVQPESLFIVIANVAVAPFDFLDCDPSPTSSQTNQSSSSPCPPPSWSAPSFDTVCYNPSPIPSPVARADHLLYSAVFPGLDPEDYSLQPDTVDNELGFLSVPPNDLRPAPATSRVPIKKSRRTRLDPDVDAARSSVRDAASHLGHLDLFGLAQFTTGATLTQRASQHRALTRLLLALNLQHFKQKPGLDHFIYTSEAAGEVMLSRASVFRGCSWNMKTYTNMVPIYTAVELVTKLTWKSPVPMPSSGAIFDLYKIWAAAQYLWSALGPIETGVEPSAESIWPAETYAVDLKQVQLAQLKSKDFRETYLEGRALGNDSGQFH